MALSRRTATVAIVLAVLVVGVVAVVALRSAGKSPAPVAAPATTTAAVPPSAAPSSSAEAPGWVGTWAVAVQQSDRGFRDQTLRQIVHTSIGGDTVRVRISNEFGTVPLDVRNVQLARHAGDGRIVTGTGRALAFDGNSATSVPVGSAVTSDPARFQVPAFAELAVSFHLPAASGSVTSHDLAGRTNYAAGGDQSSAAALSGARRLTNYSFLAGVDVRNQSSPGVVVALGASITDGFHSTSGANKRWPDLLARRLADAGRTIGVLNAGISGNELTKATTGESVLRRFDRDVLAQPGVQWVIFSDNVLNELGDSDQPTDDEITTAVRQLIDRSHAAGIKIFCSTLTPFEGADYWTEDGEAGRAAYNKFVRDTGNGCDGVIDQDAAVHDPAAKTRYRDTYDSGDHLHPNDRGMQAIADSIDLNLFR